MSCHKNIHFIDAHSNETALDMVCFGLSQNVLNWNCLVVMLDSFLKIFCINHGSLSPRRAKESKEYNKILFWRFIVLCNRASLLWFWCIQCILYTSSNWRKWDKGREIDKNFYFWVRKWTEQNFNRLFMCLRSLSYLRLYACWNQSFF